MKMGIAEKQNIAVQHAYFNRHGGRRAHRQPMSFKEWMQQGIEHYKTQGFTFELVTDSMMRISRPGQNSILRTCSNFLDEYQNEYLSKF